MRVGCGQVLGTVLAALAIAGGVNAQGVAYTGFGLGGQLGFAVLDNGLNPVDAAFDVAAVGDLGFSLGRFGEVHYRPAVGLWFGGDERAWSYTDPLGTRYTTQSWFYLEVRFDFADLAYYFPLPAEFLVHPYVGLGPSLLIDRWAYEDDFVQEDDTDVNVGFNFYGGAEFRFGGRFAAFAEMRGRVSDWNLFRLGGGMTVTVAHP